MNRIRLPYCSQINESGDPEWALVSCGIACIKMVGDFVSAGQMPELPLLIEEGKKMGGYSQVGWAHWALTAVLRNHGISAYSQEFRSAAADKLPDYVPGTYSQKISDLGVNKIEKEMQEGRPVITSLRVAGSPHTHLVVLCGISADSYFYMDPKSRNEEEGSKTISKTDCLRSWRRFAIFVD